MFSVDWVDIIPHIEWFWSVKGVFVLQDVIIRSVHIPLRFFW